MSNRDARGNPIGSLYRINDNDDPRLGCPFDWDGAQWERYDPVVLVPCPTCHGEIEILRNEHRYEKRPCPDCLTDRDGNPTGYIVDCG